MMTFEEFKTEVKAKILGYLTSDFQNVKIERIQKNNGFSYDGLVVKPGQNGVSPILNLEQFYHTYKDGVNFEDVLLAMAEDFKKYSKDGNKMEKQFNEAKYFEKAKNRIMPELINVSENKQLLKSIPHQMIADLAVIYVILIEGVDGYIATTKISNALMKMYGLTVDELHRLAVENMEKHCEIEFIGLGQKILGEMNVAEKSEETEPVNVLSVLNDIGGSAAAVLSEKVMERVIDKVGENFYILPASVHEVLIVSADLNSANELQNLQDIVKSVNAETLDPKERLSDAVYIYDREKKEIRIAEF